MRKGSFTIFGIAAGLWAWASFLFLMPQASAAPFAMPNLKSQFKKQDLTASSQVTMQADQVSFSTVDNKAHAQGNVVIKNKDTLLYCDQLQLDRVVQQVVAQGDVYLDTPQEQVLAQGLTYNFKDGTGEFRDARVYLDPYQVKGQKIDKVSENYMTMDEGYLTTCDLDEPHYRMGAHRMDIYQHDRAIVHGMKIYLGNVPVMYLPYYVQDLKNRPILTFIPGEKKDFGLFLLTTARFQVGSHLKVALHADVRERDGFGEGFDVNYNTPNFGRGLVSAYYTDENQIASHHLWDLYRNGVKVGPTTHHERYRIIWRHQWQIDKSTNVVLQYYKIHDYDITNNGFLKTYFPRDYEQNAQNSSLDTYFLLTHNMPHGTLTFNVDTSRENRPIRGIERIPEIQYILNNEQIGKTGFYAKSSNVFSDLSYQNYPKTFNEKTLRFDSNNDISHPFKVGFISFNPHLGGEETYYSRTANIDQSNIIRGMFRGSLDMSTKFYKVWDYHTNFAGLNINGLRHVITPTVTYLYQARPTFPAYSLNQFDPSIDDLYRIHQFEFGLENKLQTKRNGQAVDLLRFLTTVNYGLKGTTGHRGFNPYDTLLDFNPTNWLTFHNDNEYDFHAGHWNSENFDGEIHGTGWSFSLGSRYTRHEGDQITTEIDYTINPKWKFKIYNSFPVVHATDGNTTSARENEYVLTRDLHEWEMDLSIDQQQGQGSTFYVLFRLKASPGMKFNLVSTSFQPSRPGTQNQ
jgi:lipopolysaccharide assembly outer membrane protein LptD (OstA)